MLNRADFSCSNLVTSQSSTLSPHLSTEGRGHYLDNMTEHHCRKKKIDRQSVCKTTGFKLRFPRVQSTSIAYSNHKFSSLKKGLFCMADTP